MMCACKVCFLVSVFLSANDILSTLSPGLEKDADSRQEDESIFRRIFLSFDYGKLTVWSIHE
eukprot:scaffold13902_cov173-Amphora_coffeaeformis.AAC.3